MTEKSEILPTIHLNNEIPESINFHITDKCNYRCKFCFAKYQNMAHCLTIDEYKWIISELADHGCQKLNFAGGEPTLIPYLPALINHAKKENLYVSLISNGTGIDEEFLNKCGNSLDIIGMSIDSQFNDVEFALGRTLKTCKKPSDYSHVDLIKKKAELVIDYGIPLKINTTITDLNWNEDMKDFIRDLNPVRWKVFQVHHLSQVNDEFFQKYGISEEKFKSFIDNHKELNPVFESSDMMLDSYCMITPDGCFYQGVKDRYKYSAPIRSVGLEKAFSEIKFDRAKYIHRKGDYFKERFK